MRGSDLDGLLRWLEAEHDPWQSANEQVTVTLVPPKHADAIRSLRALMGFCEILHQHPGIHSARLAQFMNSHNGQSHWHFSLTVTTCPDQRTPIEVVWSVHSQTLAITTKTDGHEQHPVEDVRLAMAFSQALQPLMPGIGIQRQVVLGRGVTNFTFTQDVALEAVVARAVSPEVWAAYRSEKLRQTFSEAEAVVTRPRF